jgi:4'-phosphopantetheinyl transferase
VIAAVAADSVWTAPPPDPAMEPSLAHSGEVALVAIAHGIQIGVDVERLRNGTEGWSLVTHALAAGEQAMLRAFPASRRSEAFLSV